MSLEENKKEYMAKKITKKAVATKKAIVMKAEKKVVAAKPAEKVAEKTAKKKDETQKTVQELQKEIVIKKMELRMGKLKDVRSISKTLDEIARLKTMERMKELTQ